MPTGLPRQRPTGPKASLLRSAISVLFNTFLVVSALALAIVVLEREERYALGQANDPAAAEQAAQQETMMMAPQ